MSYVRGLHDAEVLREVEAIDDQLRELGFSSCGGDHLASNPHAGFMTPEAFVRGLRGYEEARDAALEHYHACVSGGADVAEAASRRGTRLHRATLELLMFLSNAVPCDIGLRERLRVCSGYGRLCAGSW